MRPYFQHFPHPQSILPSSCRNVPPHVFRYEQSRKKASLREKFSSISPVPIRNRCPVNVRSFNQWVMKWNACVGKERGIFRKTERQLDEYYKALCQKANTNQTMVGIRREDRQMISTLRRPTNISQPVCLPTPPKLPQQNTPAEIPVSLPVEFEQNPVPVSNSSAPLGRTIICQKCGHCKNKGQFQLQHTGRKGECGVEASLRRTLCTCNTASRGKPGPHFHPCTCTNCQTD